MRNTANLLRLLTALVLCALACVAAVVGGAPAFRTLAIGLFMVAAPGLVVVTMLRLRDPLLSIVVGMVVGPAAWVLLATVATFLGLWWPGPTVVVVAVLVGAWALFLMLAELRTPASDLEYAAFMGRHRGAFPFR